MNDFLTGLAMVFYLLKEAEALYWDKTHEHVTSGHLIICTSAVTLSGWVIPSSTHLELPS